MPVARHRRPFVRSTSIAACVVALALGSAAVAGDVVWPALGLDEDLITGKGQAFDGFAGIGCLQVVMRGSENVDAPYIHPSQELWYRSDEFEGDTRPPAVIDLEFDRPVSITLTLRFFGDGGVREQFRVSAPGGSFSATASGGQEVTGSGTAELLFLSVDGGSPTIAEIAGVVPATMRMELDGADALDLAGITLEMTVEDAPANPDLDGSGAVDGADLAVLLGSWGACPEGCCDTPADLDGDGDVDGGDLAVLLGSWG